MRGLSDRVIAVTGSAGIAESTARRLSAEGARVAVIGIEPGEVAALAESLDGATGHVADLTDDDAAGSVFTEVLSTHGRLDGAAAIVGGSGRRFGDGPIGQMTSDAWQQTMELNTRPLMATVRAAVGSMTRGSIVIVSSVLAVHPGYPHFETHAYAAAKGAAISLARSVAGSYASKDIRVNSVLPAATRTPGAARAEANQVVIEHLKRKQPLAGGLLDPDDVAAAIAFLLSDDAHMITGQSLIVDGGWSVTDTGS